MRSHHYFNTMQTNETFKAFDIMHYSSKAVILIPVIIVLLAVFFNITQKITVADKTITATPTVTPSPVPLIPTEPPIRLDLKGPLMCIYSEKLSSANVMIKNENINIQLRGDHSENILVNGDCAYKWEPTKRIGQKMCGISSYIKIYESFSSLGQLNLDSLLGFLQLSDSTADKNLPSKEFLQHVINSCQKQDVKDSSFIVPKIVTFKESKSKENSAFPLGL